MSEKSLFVKKRIIGIKKYNLRGEGFMKQQTEVKKRFKMYKAKKHWVVAPILFIGVLGVVGLATDDVQAAELDTQPGTTTVQPDNPIRR